MLRMLATIAVFGVMSAGCDLSTRSESVLTPQFVTSENDNLTDDEEAELLRQAKVTQFVVEAQAQSSWGPGFFNIWTEGTIPFGIFFPRFKHDATYQITINGTSQSPVLVPGDWRIGSPYPNDLLADRWDERVVSLECGSEGVRSGRLWVNAHSRAKWEYFKFSALLRIEPDAMAKIAQDDCPPIVVQQPGGGGSKADEDPTYCWVEYTYDAGTGEIISSRVLYCEQ